MNQECSDHRCVQRVDGKCGLNIKTSDEECMLGVFRYIQDKAALKLMLIDKETWKRRCHEAESAKDMVLKLKVAAVELMEDQIREAYKDREVLQARVKKLEAEVGWSKGDM